jgi:hypothetical protein
MSWKRRRILRMIRLITDFNEFTDFTNFMDLLLTLRIFPMIRVSYTMSQPQLPRVIWASRIHGCCCKNATSSAVHESGVTPAFTTSRHLLSTPHISLCRPVIRFPPEAPFFEAIF